MWVRLPPLAQMINGVVKPAVSNVRWSSKLAYCVGLITTDGSLSKDGRHIAFRSSDYQLVETFRDCLQLTNSISQSKSYDYQWSVKPSYIIQIGNVRLYRFLEKIGLTPAKTHTISSLIIPDRYFADFLRGHLDGDGTISLYQDHTNSYRGRRYINCRLSLRFLSASKAHIEWLQSRIGQLTNCSGAAYDRAPRHATGVRMWTLKFSKRESTNLINFMYYSDDLPCLERKRLKADEARITISKHQRKTYSRITNAT